MGARLVFFGTPEFAVPSLRACLEVGTVVAVVTQPDRPRGRGQHVQASPVKEEAERAGVPVLQPPKLKGTDFGARLRALEPEVAVVTAYGRILPQDVLDAPRRGCLNVHASLLPRWRGAAPIQWAIAAGDAETGVCLMQMEAGLDTGPVLATRREPVRPTDTSGSLHARLAELGGALLRDALPRYLAGELRAVPQSETGVTVARMVEKEDGRLDWTRPAEELERRVRAFTPWPGGWTELDGHGLQDLADRGRGGQRPPGDRARQQGRARRRLRPGRAPAPRGAARGPPADDGPRISQRSPAPSWRPALRRGAAHERARAARADGVLSPGPRRGGPPARRTRPGAGPRAPHGAEPPRGSAGRCAVGAARLGAGGAAQSRPAGPRFPRAARGGGSEPGPGGRGADPREPGSRCLGQEVAPQDVCASRVSGAGAEAYLAGLDRLSALGAGRKSLGRTAAAGPPAAHRAQGARPGATCPGGAGEERSRARRWPPRRSGAAEVQRRPVPSARRRLLPHRRPTRARRSVGNGPQPARPDPRADG